MNEDDYLKLPSELREKITNLYNIQDNNHSPDFNRGQKYILEELFGYTNCSSYKQITANNNIITYEFSGKVNKVNDNGTLNFIPDDSIENIMNKERELKELVKENTFNCKLKIELDKING